MKNKIEYIAFDADDTLWVNELYFHQFEAEFCSLISKYLPADEASKKLFDTEMKNLPLYGYGAKGMTLCMIELASKVVAPQDLSECILQILELGKQLLQKPIELLDGVQEVLTALNNKYKLILATKGDLLDQERKIAKSGLAEFFHHGEIMSDKKTSDYALLMKHLGCKPENFLMIGNSLKSDIVPVLELGGYAAYVPYHITWQHEQSDRQIENSNFIKLDTITQILEYLD